MSLRVVSAVVLAIPAVLMAYSISLFVVHGPMADLGRQRAAEPARPEVARDAAPELPKPVSAANCQPGRAIQAHGPRPLGCPAVQAKAPDFATRLHRGEIQTGAQLPSDRRPAASAGPAAFAPAPIGWHG